MRGLLTGLLASVGVTFLMGVLRLAAGVPSPPEVALDALTALLPLRLFSLLVGWLGGGAKPLLLGLLVAGQLALGAGLGWLWTRGVSKAGARAWVYALALSLMLWIASMVGLLPLAGKGPFGLGLSMAMAWLLLSLVYGALLVLLSQRRLSPPTPLPGRRRFLVRLSAALVGAALSAGLGKLLWGWLGAEEEDRTPTLTPEVTPTEDFYTVSKNFLDPTVEAAPWRLEVAGLVDNPLTLDYAALRGLPSVTRYLTLECISNEVGGDLIGNAHWKGVPLRDILLQAGVREAAYEVVLRAQDGYSDSIPLAKALEPGTMIAYEMNGQPLTPSHGFPARLLVPGIYGMKNVKWLTRIELVDYEYYGFWQQREWSDTALIQTMSRIDFPRWRTYRPGEIGLVAGIAFAGDRGISRVEVSPDEGQSWFPAQVKASLSPYTWVLWRWEWTPPGPGRYTILVRAADGQGELQSPEAAPPLPEGATGYHRVTVSVVA